MMRETWLSAELFLPLGQGDRDRVPEAKEKEPQKSSDPVNDCQIARYRNCGLGTEIESKHLQISIASWYNNYMFVVSNKKMLFYYIFKRAVFSEGW